MAQERPNRLVEWLLHARRSAPVVRQHLEDWVEACKQEPRLIWETAAVRYATYLVSGLILVKIASTTVAALAPPPPALARPAATKADFHVLCTEAGCGTHFVIHRRFGFRDFPVACPTCGKAKGYWARPCASATCRGTWVVPVEDRVGRRCPRCGGPM